MSFKKLSIMFSIAILVFVSSINTSYATEISDPISTKNDFIKTLDYLDNTMYILIKSISEKNFNEDEVIKQIKFSNSLISDISKRSTQLQNKQNDIAAALQAVSSFYKLSVIKTESYIESKNADDLISAISTFSIGYSSSVNLRNLVFGAGK